MQLKLISLNLAGFKDWESREQKIVDFIDAEQPDVVLFQEVKYDAEYSSYSQSITLNKLLDSPFPFTQTTVSKFYQPSGQDAYREGLAVLSKFPITNSEALVLNKEADDKHPRIVLNVDLAIGDFSVGITNVHLSNNKYSVDQLSELLSILQSRKERRLIVGDFNIFDLEKSSALYQYEYIASTEIEKYISFPSEGATLDYALIPRDMQVGSLRTNEGLSDHAAVILEVGRDDAIALL